MHLFFDESGDFAFPDDRFDVYVQAVLICPDSLIGMIERYIEKKKADRGLDELHAIELMGALCRQTRNGQLRARRVMPGASRRSELGASFRRRRFVGLYGRPSAIASSLAVLILAARTRVPVSRAFREPAMDLEGAKECARPASEIA
jgi:hypothetical protein